MELPTPDGILDLPPREFDLLVTLMRSVGKPADHRERIFERFQRGESGSDQGNGLGLAIVQEVISLHGGKLLLTESDLGGCGFLLKFPAR